MGVSLECYWLGKALDSTSFCFFEPNEGLVLQDMVRIWPDLMAVFRVKFCKHMDRIYLELGAPGIFTSLGLLYRVIILYL